LWLAALTVVTAKAKAPTSYVVDLAGRYSSRRGTNATLLTERFAAWPAGAADPVLITFDRTRSLFHGCGVTDADTDAGFANPVPAPGIVSIIPVTRGPVFARRGEVAPTGSRITEVLGAVVFVVAVRWLVDAADVNIAVVFGTQVVVVTYDVHAQVFSANAPVADAATTFVRARLEV
jgi:hypothetical protein